jgi:hypothetical protein
MAQALQYHPTALIAAISTTRTAGFCAAVVPSRWDSGYAAVSIPLVQNIRQATRAWLVSWRQCP